MYWCSHMYYPLYFPMYSLLPQRCNTDIFLYTLQTSIFCLFSPSVRSVCFIRIAFKFVFHYIPPKVLPSVLPHVIPYVLPSSVLLTLLPYVLPQRCNTDIFLYTLQTSISLLFPSVRLHRTRGFFFFPASPAVPGFVSKIFFRELFFLLLTF